MTKQTICVIIQTKSTCRNDVMNVVMNVVTRNKQIEFAPSLICMDLCNLENEVHFFDSLGCKVLHVDLIDGYFSPSMPIGLDTLRQLKKKTDMVFDAHLMAQSNAFFVRELIDIGCERICFHLESEQRPEAILQMIKSAGCKAGLALSPGTPVDSLKYLIHELDHVLLMQIPPGYAHLPGQCAMSFMPRKIKDLLTMMQETGRYVSITVDGRVNYENIGMLLNLGVNTFVCGTGCLFRKGESIEKNWRKLCAMIYENRMGVDML